MADREYFGFIKMETQAQFSMEWEILKYHSIRQEKNVKWISPRFSLFNSTWHLTLMPGGSSLHNSEEYIGMWLGSPNPPPLRISFILGIKASDGSIYKFASFTKKVQKLYMGTAKLLKRSDLHDEDIFDASGSATFFCNISHPNCKMIEAETQTSYHDNYSTLSQDYKNIFLNETCSDVTIKVQDQEIRAHSQILAARCLAFQSMFTHEMKEKKTGVVDVEDCEPAAFREFLSFLYCGEIEEMSDDNVIDIYAIAHKYYMPELKTKCLEFMKETLRIDSFCDVFSLAIKYKDSELIRSATEFFIKEGKQILRTLKWLTFAKAFPLQSNELVIKVVDHLSH